MARSAVDLPDPLENANVDAAGGADDLLSQLAGDEIDRLISETDAAPPPAEHVDRPSTRRSTPPAAAADISAKAISNANESAMEALLTESAEAERAADSIEHSKPSAEEMRSAEELIARQAAELIAQVERENAEMAAAAANPVPEPASAASALAEEMEADERAHAAALKRMADPEGADAPLEATAEAAPEATIEADEARHGAADVAAESQIDESEVDLSQPVEPEENLAPRVPLLVRFLELLNAPLASISDTARQAIGKIALVTSVNAIAVLLYVLISRKH